MPHPAKAGLLAQLTIDHQILNLVAGLDEFRGRWAYMVQHIPAEIMADLGRRATVESVGASCRISGGRLTDMEVDRFLFGPEARQPRSPDERIAAGYAEALEMIYESGEEEKLDTGFIRRLHGAVTWYGSASDVWRGPYGAQPAAQAGAAPAPAGDQDPRRVPVALRELVQRTTSALESGAYHPILVASAFTHSFLAMHPFQQGNGRLSRLLATWMMHRSGYGYVALSSIERVLEESIDRFHRLIAGPASPAAHERAGLQEWTRYMLHVLASQRDALERRLERYDHVARLQHLSERLLALARSRARITMAAAMSETGSGRNTIKVHLRRLVAEGVLERHGAGRGAWYTLA